MPEVYTSKRRSLAWEAAQASKQIVDAVEKLELIAATVTQSGGGFEDGDFPEGSDMQHVNAWKMNVAMTQVTPALRAALGGSIGGGSPVTLLDILLAMRPGP